MMKRNKVGNIKAFLTGLFPIILSILSLYLFFPNINSNVEDINTGDMSWAGFVLSIAVFSIPFIGFLIIAGLYILRKIKAITAIIMTVLWIIACIPFTWFIAIMVDRFVFLGVELYL